jgi:enediyne biosynthesis protein E4
VAFNHKPRVKKLFVHTAVFALLSVTNVTAQPLFRSLPAAETGITFQNKLIETPALNIITYEYYYNGGGVATGDFNNDGLIDIFFTANLLPNALYLNKGNMRFEDITKRSGMEGRRGWKTGVSVADVNDDGYLDVYVCYSGDVEAKYRKNQLFINNHDLTFTDRAEAYGVADAGYTTHAVFFDYDRDLDLDLFVLNHNVKNLRNFDAAFVKKMVDEGAGDRLYRNDGNKFTDVTITAGIISNPLGYGLAAIASDINNDGWTDLYVTNDYVEEDYLYINNGDGTFSESLKQQLGHISNFSMGADIADINNDGWMDIFTLDMLPADNKRQKLLYAPDNYELYNNQVNNGFHHQLMRNMLQVNNGDNTFSETGQLSGISNTDWSWAALFADFNNDGKKDLFVTNGYGRDMINRDFVKFYANERLKFLQGQPSERMFQMLQGIKTTPLHNYFFENAGNLQFIDKSAVSGFSEEDLSHGAAYADLDNDGDVDLVVNRMNADAAIFRNNSAESNKGGNYVQLQLRMPEKNRFALGAKVTVHSAGVQVKYENFPVHGFQSAMQGPLHIGLPGSKIDSIKIIWPDGSVQVMKDVATNQRVTINWQKAPGVEAINNYNYILASSSHAIPFQHRNAGMNDFKMQPLMPVMISNSGPRTAKADVNGDGLEDVYICGGARQNGQLLLQLRDGGFSRATTPQWELDEREETDAIFFDADNDKDADLLIVYGSYTPVAPEKTVTARLYINNKGVLALRPQSIPFLAVSASTVRAADVDGDGDQDLFLGGRVSPGAYPVRPQSFLLLNDGTGNYKDETLHWSAAFKEAGMITDALWMDVNKDSRPDLFICGEWMPVRLFINDGKKLTEQTQQYFGPRLAGWWNRLLAFDADMDGDLDLAAGNWGTNSQVKANEQEPATLYFADFDKNGSMDPLLVYYIQGRAFPMASRDELTDQVVSWRQKFPTYDSYSSATIDEILSPEQRSTVDSLQANFFETCWWENQNGKFILHRLPQQANFSPVYALAADDFTGDGKPDLLLAGNLSEARIKLGRMDANYGVLLSGDGKGNFQYIPQTRSGLSIKGQARDIITIKRGAGKLLLLTLTNALPQLYEYK